MYFIYLLVLADVVFESILLGELSVTFYVTHHFLQYILGRERKCMCYVDNVVKSCIFLELLCNPSLSLYITS